MPYYSDDELMAAARHVMYNNEQFRREAEEAKRYKQEGWFSKFLKGFGFSVAIDVAKKIFKMIFGWP